MSDKRHFTIVEGKKEHGLFVSSTPSGAARKVVSKLSKGKKVTFYLREITQGSKKKVYGPYEGMKKKLSKPVKVGDIVYKYEPVVKKMDGGFLFQDDNQHEIVIKVDNKTFKITKKSPSIYGKKLRGEYAKYSLITSEGTSTIVVMVDGKLEDLIKEINNLLDNHVCGFMKQLEYKSMEKNEVNIWQNLLKSLYCDINKNKSFIENELKRKKNSELVNKISHFGNWIKNDKKRQNIFIGLNKKKYELYGKRNGESGELDYDRLMFDIESQADFERWMNRNSNRKNIFNSLTNENLNSYVKKNGSVDYDNLRLFIDKKTKENNGIFSKYFR